MRWFKKNKKLQTADQLKFEHAQFELDRLAYNRKLKDEEIRLKPIRDKAEAEQIAYKQRWALIEQEKRDKIQEDSKMREGTASTREDSRMSRADKEIESRPEFVQMWAEINLMSSQIDNYKKYLKASETNAWLETQLAEVGNLHQIIDNIQFTKEKRIEHYALRVRQEQKKQGRWVLRT